MDSYKRAHILFRILMMTCIALLVGVFWLSSELNRMRETLTTAKDEMTLTSLEKKSLQSKNRLLVMQLNAFKKDAKKRSYKNQYEDHLKRVVTIVKLPTGALVYKWKDEVEKGDVIIAEKLLKGKL